MRQRCDHFVRLLWPLVTVCCVMLSGSGCEPGELPSGWRSRRCHHRSTHFTVHSTSLFPAGTTLSSKKFFCLTALLFAKLIEVRLGPPRQSLGITAALWLIIVLAYQHYWLTKWLTSLKFCIISCMFIVPYSIAMLLSCNMNLLARPTGITSNFSSEACFHMVSMKLYPFTV